MKRTHRFSQRRAKQDRRSGSRVKAWVATFICIGLIGPVNSVHGQVVIDTDTVIDAGHSFPNSAIEVIDGANPPTIVEIVDGGAVWDSPTTSVLRDSSTVNITGGTIEGDEATIKDGAN